ncbi:MAG: hypothetical protein FK734_20920 [Asgard group archaeon]|nr:hypothetical protein [Asgard group archaeon]
MNEIKEIPFEDHEQEDNLESEDDVNGLTPEELEERRKHLAISLNKRFGFIILILGLAVLTLTIISFFVHMGEPDSTALLAEQITGFVLSGISAIIGTILLLTARRMKKEQAVSVEPIADFESNV